MPEIMSYIYNKSWKLQFSASSSIIIIEDYYLQTFLHSLEILMKQMLEKNPINEKFKNTDPLKWTGLMNNYKHSAEEIIFKELIYI